MAERGPLDKDYVGLTLMGAQFVLGCHAGVSAHQCTAPKRSYPPFLLKDLWIAHNERDQAAEWKGLFASASPG